MNAASSPSSTTPAVEFYWRPGCPFCSMLERSLTRSGLALDKRNIWDDPAAAARVREVARGNETVPTVVVGEKSFVNPSAGEVLQAVRELAPDWAG